MRSIFVLLILVMIGLNGKGQSVTALPDSVLSQCCLEVTLLNGNVTTVDWVFIQYITRDGTGTKLFVEYAPNFGGIQWETQIRIQDNFDDVLARSKFIILPFTVGTTDYGIHRNWIANLEENTTTGGTWIYGRFGTPTKRKFSAVEDYETLKNLLLACRPRAIVVAENGLYTEGDTVRMGGFLIENTRVQLEGYPLTFIDTTSKQSFGVGAGTLPGYLGDTVGYFARRSGGFRQFILQGNRYNQIVIRDTSSVFGDYAEIYQGLYFGDKPYMYLDVTDREFDGKISRISIDADSVSFRNSPYLSSVDAYIRYFTAKAGRVSVGVIEGELSITGTGVEMGAYGYGVGGGASEYLFMKTKAVDNGTANVGQYLKLLNTSTGEVDFATIDLSSYAPISYVDSLYATDHDRDSTNEIQTLAFASPLLGISSGNTVNLSDLLIGYVTGSGTNNRVPKWSALTNLTDSNIQDNNTAVSILNSKPFLLGQWTTAGRPTGVNGYMGWNTTFNWFDAYSVSGWFSPAQTSTTGGVFTSGRFPRADANGRLQDGLLSESSNVISVTSNNLLQFGKWANIGARPTLGEAQVGYNQATKSFEYSDGSTVYNLGFWVPSAANIYFLQKVGIGTSTMTGMLNISSTGGTNDQLRILSTSAASLATTEWYNQSSDVLQVYNAGSSYSSGIFTSRSSGISYSGTGGYNIITYGSGAPIRFATGGVATTNERMRITSTGLVGIGQTSPSRTLEVNGEVRIVDLTTDSPTRIVGADTDGDLAAITVSTGLSLSGGVLTATGASTWIKTELEASRDVDITGGTSTDFRIRSNTRTQFDGIFKVGADSIMRVKGTGLVKNPGSSIFSSAFFGGGALELRQQVANFQPILSMELDSNRNRSFITFRKYNGNSVNILTTSDGISETGALVIQAQIRNDTSSTCGISFDMAKIDAFNNISQPMNADFVRFNAYTTTHKTGQQANGNWYWGADKNTIISPSGDSIYHRGDLKLGLHGVGNKEASDLSKTQSNYVAGFATDGTILDLKIGTGLAISGGELTATASAPTQILAESYNRITSTSSPQTFSSTISDNLVDQGGTQASFTFYFPASPVDGQVLTMTWNNAISTLTLDGNGNTIVGSAVTTAVAGSQRKFKYCGTCTTPAWIKIY